MFDTGKLYYIVDAAGNFYKLNEKNNLVVAKDSQRAALFTIQEANKHIGTGRKSRFYSLLEADVVPTSIDTSDKVEADELYDAEELDEFETPTLFDGLNNDWGKMLDDLCYMSEHMDDYQGNLNQMLSDVDKEICDIMHYLEFEDLDDTEMLSASKMLRDRRRHRREIKDEMDRTDIMKSTFLDGNFGIKVQQSIDSMGKMEKRQYTPRKLCALFQEQKVSA